MTKDFGNLIRNANAVKRRDQDDKYGRRPLKNEKDNWK